MFDASPAFADDAAFATSVERRLARVWLVRRLALTAAGVVGGAVALSRLPDLRLALADATAWFGGFGDLLVQPDGGVGVWMAAGVAAAAVVLLRRVEV